MGVGMPETLLLEQFGSHVWAVFGSPPYLVGSALTNKQFRDVDVRMMLDDELYELMGLGDPVYPHHNEKWVALCLAFSALGKSMTGLPIDFQIQQISLANETYNDDDNKKHMRSSLGFVPHRMKKYKE